MVSSRIGDGPAVPLGVPDVHPGQVGGEQRRLLAALTGLHLEHDVVGVVRVARRQEVGEMGFEFFDGCGEFVDLGGERLVVGRQFARGARSPRAASSLR